MAVLPNENLAVLGLPADVSEDKVKSIFGQYGLVAQAKVLPPMVGQQQREAFVRMSSLEEARWMVENINDNILDGMITPVTVRYSPHKGPLSPWGGLPQSVLAPPGVVPIPPKAAFGVMPPAATQGKTPIQLLASAVANSLVPPAGMPPAQAVIPIGTMISGTVRRWDASKGFGFIGADCGGPDVFVHARELSDGEVLIPGSKVMFEAMLDVARGPGKYRAKMCMGAKPKPPTAPAAPGAAVPGVMGLTVPALSAPPVAESDRLLIQGVPVDVTEDKLNQVFSQYGPLVSVTKLNPAPGATYASCVVQFQIQAQAKWLLENVNNNIPLGLESPVGISYAGPSLQALTTADSGYGKAMQAGTSVAAAPY